jgi:hypothetical protein
MNAKNFLNDGSSNVPLPLPLNNITNNTNKLNQMIKNNKENNMGFYNSDYNHLNNNEFVYLNRGQYTNCTSVDDNISMKKYSTKSIALMEVEASCSMTKIDLLNTNINSNSNSILKKYSNQIPHEYLLDIWETLKSEEVFNQVDYEFIIKNQRDINEKMRAILVDWLVEVHHRFNLTHETLFLTVNLIDRYISKKEILRTKLQLIGVAALFIACKYEEILCPDLKDFVYITDKTYSKKEILDTEQDILLTLQYNICVPTYLRFFEIIALNFNFNEVEFTYGKFLLESYLIDLKCNKYPPSLVSSAAAYIIMKTNNYTNYQDIYKIISSTSKTLKECAKEIYYFAHNQDKNQFKGVYKKFSSNEFYRVSIEGMSEMKKWGK